MANGQTITRRGILKAAPAAVVTAAIPAALAAMPAEGPSEIMKLFRAWHATRTSPPPDDAPIVTVNAWCDKLAAIMKEMAPLPIRSAGDLAAKLIAESCLGDFSLAPSVEMYELVGVPPAPGAERFGSLPTTW